MSDLKSKAVNSVMWTTIRTLFGLVAMPMLLILKARYLSPTEFGVLSIINLFMSIINVIENTGLNKAIVQKKELAENEKSSLFIFQILLGIVLALLLVFFSPLVAQVFGMPSLNQLLPIMSIIILISSPLAVLSSFLEKEIKFKELSLVEMTRNTTLLISVFIFFSVFDLGLLGVILGQIISAAVGFTLLWLITTKSGLFHMVFKFNFTEVLPFLKFGLSVVSKEILNQITSRADEIIIGLFLSAEVLGYYYFAKNTLSQMRATVSGAISKVLFPLLSKVNDHPNKLKSLNNRISKYIGMVAFPMFIGLVTTSHIFIPLLFGEEWLRSNTIFVILALASIPNFISGNLSKSFLYAINKPNTVLGIELIVNSIYILILFIVSWMNIGVQAIVITYVLYLSTKPIVTQTITNKILEVSLIRYISMFKVPFIFSLIMAVIVLSSQYVMGLFFSNWVVLIVSILIGIIFYFGLYLLIDRNSFYEIKNLVFN